MHEAKYYVYEFCYLKEKNEVQHMSLPNLSLKDMKINLESFKVRGLWPWLMSLVGGMQLQFPLH